MSTFLKNLVKENSKEIKKHIKDIVEDKLSNKETIDKIKQLANNFKNKFSNELSKNIKNLTKKVFVIDYLENNIIFAYPTDEVFSVDGYIIYNNQPVLTDVYEYENKKAIYSKNTGTFVFGGNKNFIVGFDNIINSPDIIKIISKYKLNDFFEPNSIIKAYDKVSRNTVISSLARIAGAKNTDDPISFFKQKGIVVSNRDKKSFVTLQETIYLVMKVYEIKTNTNLNSVVIKNYGLTKNIKNVKQNYKKALQVAFQIGIYSNQNINANDFISNQDFLQMLVNLTNKLGI